MLKWIIAFLCISMCLFSQSAEAQWPETVDYGEFTLDRVDTSAQEINIRVPLTNRFDFPIKTTYVKTSCSCSRPDHVGLIDLAPGETKHIKFDISPGGKKALVPVTIDVYGWHKDEPIPKNQKLEDALHVGRYEVLIPVAAEFEISGFSKTLGFSPGKFAKFIFHNRSGVEWDDVHVTVEGAIVKEIEVIPDLPFAEQAFRISLSDFENEELEKLTIAFYQVMKSGIEVKRYEHVLPVEALQPYELKPDFIYLSDNKLNQYITINCRDGDARSLVNELEVRKGDEEVPLNEHWKKVALSDNWIRVLFLDSKYWEDCSQIAISLPSKKWSSSLNVTKK